MADPRRIRERLGFGFGSPSPAMSALEPVHAGVDPAYMPQDVVTESPWEGPRSWVRSGLEGLFGAFAPNENVASQAAEKVTNLSDWINPAQAGWDIGQEAGNTLQGGDPRMLAMSLIPGKAAEKGAKVAKDVAQIVADDLVPTVKAAQKKAAYRVNYGDAHRQSRMGEYDPDYFDITEDALTDPDTGEVLGLRDRLNPKPNLVSRLPEEKAPDMMWRGMSADEYEELQKTGLIQSKGEYNIGDEQRGLTYFDRDPTSAESYANSFAPEQFKPTFEKPAYVVGVKHAPEENIKHVPGVGNNEVGVTRATPAEDILKVYRGNVVDRDPGVKGQGFSSAPRSQLHWEAIDFIKKYGLVAAVGAGLITQQMADQLQAQQGGGQS